MLILFGVLPKFVVGVWRFDWWFIVWSRCCLWWVADLWLFCYWLALCDLFYSICLLGLWLMVGVLLRLCWAWLLRWIVCLWDSLNNSVDCSFIFFICGVELSNVFILLVCVVWCFVVLLLLPVIMFAGLLVGFCGLGILWFLLCWMSVVCRCYWVVDCFGFDGLFGCWWCDLLICWCSGFVYCFKLNVICIWI